MRPLTVDVDYFDGVNSDDQAYWLGFLHADADVSGRRVTFSLAEKDSHMVDEFIESIDSNYAVRMVERSNSVQKTTTISDPEFADSLRSMNVGDDKTESPDLPPVEDPYRRSYLRGYFDGDGSFHDSGVERPKPSWTIHAKNEQKLELIYSWLANYGVTGGGIYDGHHSSRLILGGRDDIMTVWNTLWPSGIDTEPSLARKAETIEQFVTKVSES